MIHGKNGYHHVVMEIMTRYTRYRTMSKISYIIMRTQGFTDIPGKQQVDILTIASKKIGVKPDFLVFDSEQETTIEEEDGGRTLRIAYPKLDEKVYVKLDDYGDADTLSENVGYRVETQYVATFMLASEY